MPTENDTPSTTPTTESETPVVEQPSQQVTTETVGNEPPQPSTPSEPVKLPDDHPLVKTLKANKDKIAAQNSEMAELRSKSAKVTQLETELAARPSQEALDTLQTRYDRLEGFLQAVGGPLGNALDSRTFTRELFETDKDIATLVKEWNRANPSATSAALGSGAAAPADKKPDMNDLLRSALK